jgi:hypothetical protein
MLQHNQAPAHPGRLGDRPGNRSAPGIGPRLVASASKMIHYAMMVNLELLLMKDD